MSIESLKFEISKRTARGISFDKLCKKLISVVVEIDKGLFQFGVSPFNLKVYYKTRIILELDSYSNVLKGEGAFGSFEFHDQEDHDKIIEFTCGHLANFVKTI